MDILRKEINGEISWLPLTVEHLPMTSSDPNVEIIINTLC